MTPTEFKAWFDGFTEAFEGAPSEAQWVRIKTRVAEIDGKPVTERVYVDRYLPLYPSYPYRPYWGGLAYGSTGLGTSNATLCNVTATASGDAYHEALTNKAGMFDSTDAMHSLGRAEAMGVA